MLAAAVLALLWSNSPWWHSYESVWSTKLTFRLGTAEISTDLRQWVDQGLMTFFFLVVGLEAKRELDMGELRERRRLAVPAFAAIGGFTVPIAIYLAFNAGGAGARGWGAAMSTDTAFALGALALLTPRAATRMRVFLLTLAVVDDLCALLVIATVYTHHVSVVALLVAFGLLGVLIALHYAPFGRRVGSIIAAIALWVAMFKSGIDPVISGLVIGLATSAYSPSREDLERATSLTRSFREQPTPELARSAQDALVSAISANERLQHDLHPWTSYLIVPLFALANTGVHLTGSLLGDAVSSPITLGIVVGYVIGKPIGVSAGAWLASRPALHGPRSPISGPLLVAGGACAGIGFTVSILISSLAFTGRRLDEARLGALASVVLAPALAWVILRLVGRLPSAVRARQISATAAGHPRPRRRGGSRTRSHPRPGHAPVTLVEYGDFECSYCGQAESVIRELLTTAGDDVRYVWRHLPLNDVHPNGQFAAEASEAAAAQGKFWDMYDLLLGHQDALTPRDMAAYAKELGLDVERFLQDLRKRVHVPRVAADVASADESGVSGTPTFFINGRRHYGVYDIDALTQAIRAAKRRVRLTTAPDTTDAPGPEVADAAPR